MKRSLLAIAAGLRLLASHPAAAMPLERPVDEYVFMQIVAHPDDDLLFMNPDLMNTLGAGYGSVTVMLTAAEADGGADGESKEVFAAQRQAGLRAAYASMVGVANSWTRTSLWVGDHAVELATLLPAPHVRIVFINLPDGGDPAVSNSLLGLYEDPGLVRDTFIPWGGVVATSYGYTKESLRQTLVALLQTFQPSNVRTLDPQPVLICGAHDEFGNCVNWLLDDNPDHKSAARFTDLALEDYDGPWGSRFCATFYYKGYAISDHRGNLGATSYSRKRSVLDVYKMYDSNFRLYEDSYAGMFGGTYERYQNGTTWLQPQADGGLAAFAVQDRQVVMWAENGVGGHWTGPLVLGGGPVGPGLDVARYDDGRLRVVALQIPVAGAGDAPAGPQYGQRIVSAAQATGNGPFGAWEDLGNPDPYYANLNHWTGLPAVAVNAAGYAEVFSRNGAGGVSRCVQTPTGWSDWAPLPSVTYDDVVDGLATARAVDGRLEVFASYRSGDMAHWRQQAAGDYLLDPAFPPINVAGPPTIAKNQDGRLEIFYREAGTATVRTAFFTPGGFWSTNLVDLGGHGGIGPVAAMQRGASGQIMLFARNDYNGVSATWQMGPNTSFFPTWTDLGGLIPAYPAAASDAAGRVVLATVGIGGRLYIRREVAVGVIGSFGPWTAVGTNPTDVRAPDADVVRLEPGSPNPFNPATTIRYSLAQAGRARLVVYDVRGRRVASLVDEEQAAGGHAVTWNGRMEDGSPAPSGIYLARLDAGGQSRSRKLVLAK